MKPGLESIFKLKSTSCLVKLELKDAFQIKFKADKTKPGQSVIFTPKPLMKKIWAAAWDFQQYGMWDQQSLRSACPYAQSDQSLCKLLKYSINVRLLTEHHLEFLSLKGGCIGSSESTHVKIPHCWKSHVTAHIETPQPWITDQPWAQRGRDKQTNQHTHTPKILMHLQM